MIDEKVLEAYFNLMTINGSAYVLNITRKMQLLRPFQDRELLSSQELAEILNLCERPLNLVLETLCSLSVVEKREGKYALAPVTKFLTGSYENLSSDYWEYLPKFLTSEIPYKKMDSIEESEREYQSQVKSLEWMMAPSASYIADLLGPDNFSKLLDIGAGSGVWSFAFLNRHQQAQAVLVDWAAVLKVARETAKERKISSRVHYLEGNYHQIDFPENEFDLAILGNVVHIETEEGNKHLFSKVAKSLAPGGKLMILDSFGESEKGQLARCLYQVGLALRTEHGKVYPPETLEEWLGEYGFGQFKFYSMNVIPYTMGALVAVKMR